MLSTFSKEIPAPSGIHRIFTAHVHIQKPPSKWGLLTLQFISRPHPLEEILLFCSTTLRTAHVHRDAKEGKLLFKFNCRASDENVRSRQFGGNDRKPRRLRRATRSPSLPWTTYRISKRSLLERVEFFQERGYFRSNIFLISTKSPDRRL